MINKDLVISWFITEEDLYDYDLPYLSVDDFIELPSIPDGYILKVIASKADRDYDSYGNSFLEDGYIIFSVTAPDGDSSDFKLPLSYASYEGWEYRVNGIAPTVRKEKVITTWEWA